MAEFKKISDVDVVTELTENDNILIIGSDGALKQTASSNVKGSTSWNDLTDKPFYEETEKEEIVSNLTSEMYENENKPSCNFVVGNIYDVIWNGESYGGLVCYQDGEYHYIGGEGYPFYIDDNGGGSIYIDAEGDFTLTIIGLKTTIKKIDEKYLPDMSSSGSCGIEYWTGDVTWDPESNMFTLQGLELSTGEEVEIGIRLNSDSKAPCCAKYSFIYGANNGGLSMYSLEYAHNTLYPRASLMYVYGDPGHVHQLYLTSSTETDAVSIVYPQILFVRVYRMV